MAEEGMLTVGQGDRDRLKELHGVIRGLIETGDAERCLQVHRQVKRVRSVCRRRLLAQSGVPNIWADAEIGAFAAARHPVESGDAARVDDGSSVVAVAAESNKVAPRPNPAQIIRRGDPGTSGYF